MPDHRIGISIDARDNGGVTRLQRDFQNVARTAKDLDAQFKNVDRSISQLVTRGWGSDTYTRQLRDQLNTMRQISTLLERQSRVVGNPDAQNSAKQMRQRIEQSNRDLQAVATRTTFGGLTRQGMANAGRWAGNLAIGYAGFQGFNALRSGYNDAKAQLGPLADIAKTMAPGGGSQAWANAMLAAGQGFAFSNDQLISGSQTIKNAVGSNRNFFDQIHGVAQFGRQYGFDFNTAANFFAGAFQNGVTGGTGAQMSWQQYANLVANTVQRASMQGREGQVVSTLQQLTAQISAQNMSAPNQRQLSGLFTTAARTGNQNLINNFGGLMSAVNGGMMSPGMGPMGQAFMWQSIAPGMNYWDAQLLQSAGAFASPFSVFGHGSKKTNFQSMMENAYKTFGGNTSQSDDMLAGLLHINDMQARQLINTYMPNGTFVGNPTSLNLPKKQPPNMSSLDKTKQGFLNKEQGNQGLMSHLLGFASDISNFAGAHPLLAYMTGGAAVWAGKKAITSAVRSGIVGRAFGAVGRGASSAGGFLGSLGVASEDLLGPLGVILSGGSIVNSANFRYKQREEAYLASHPGFNSKISADDPNAPWNKGLPRYASGGLVNRPTVAVVGEDGPEAIVPLRGGIANSRTSPISEAQKVVTTIMALRPWKNQIESVFGPSASGSSGAMNGNVQSNIVSMSNTLQSVLSSANSASVLPFVNYSTGGSSAGSYSGKGTKSFVEKFKPIALQAAQALGIPAQFQNNFAEFAVSQWGLESGFGSSQDSHADNNFAGIKYYPGLAGIATPGQAASDGGGYAHFGSLGAFGQGYAYFLSHNSNYSAFLNAAKNGASPQELINMIAQSGYATDPNYANAVRGALGGVQNYYGSAPSVAAQNNVKVTLTAAPVKVQIQDAAGNTVGSTLVHFTTKATYNGQASAQNHLLQSLLR